MACTSYVLQRCVFLFLHVLKIILKLRQLAQKFGVVDCRLHRSFTEETVTRPRPAVMLHVLVALRHVSMQ